MPRPRWLAHPDGLTGEERDRLAALYLAIHEGHLTPGGYDQMRALKRAARLTMPPPG
jgi:hypothetical protein